MTVIHMPVGAEGAAAPVGGGDNLPGAKGMSWTELFGETLLTKKGEVSTNECLHNSIAVGIYFSAHWCPPCRQFTPILSKQFEEAYDCKGLKVVFVSSDKDQDAFNAYYGEMPFFALPFSRQGHKETLSTKYGVSGIPTLVLLKPDGTLITKDGRDCVIKDPMGEKLPWHDGPQTIGPETIGASGGGGGGGVMKRGQTTDITQQVKSAKRQVLYAQLWGFASMIVFIGLYFWGYTTANDNCASKPLKMKRVLFGLGILNVISFVVLVCVTTAFYKSFGSEHSVKAMVYKAQGRSEEAAQEGQAGTADAYRSPWLKVLACSVPILCCLACGLVIFGIICVVSALSVGGKKMSAAETELCQGSANLYWGIFVSNIIVRACCEVRTDSVKKSSHRKLVAALGADPDQV